MLFLEKPKLQHYAKKLKISIFGKKSLKNFFYKKKNGHKKVCPFSKKNY